MHSESIGDYEIEYSGRRLPEGEGWGAFVAVYGPSHNPMHRASIFPEQRVAPEVTFATEEEAEEEAHRLAIGMVENR